MSLNSDAQPLPSDRWLPGAGIRIHAVDWGGPSDATPLLMLHGVGGNARVWDAVAPLLRIRLAGHHVVAIDQRDGGDSEHPQSAYARDDFAADVEAVQDALGGKPMVLVGHSRGAWLASWYAATRPARISHLVLVDPARLMFDSTDAAAGFYDWVRGGLGPFDSETSALDWARAHDSEARWTDVRTRSFLFGFRREQGQLVGKVPVAVVDELQRAREGGEIVTQRLASIVAPTLLLVAERQSESRRNDKLAYAQRIPNVETVMLDGSHFLHTDVPKSVAAQIVRFVDQRLL